jgi:aminoglycoside 2'-N-acetyltransferase I
VSGTELRLLAGAEAPTALLAEVRTLLDEAFRGSFSDDDWAHALGGRHVVVLDDGAVVAHAAVVPRAIDVAGRPLRTGYVEAVASRPDRQGEGLGSAAMAAVAGLVRAEHEMGALSSSSWGFYARLGWERWQGPTYVRSGARTVRTEDEDDGVMVLRFGPSAGVDLSAPISCESRPGDDW